jgi:aspartate-semialdehyde dehydrogenase
MIFRVDLTTGGKCMWGLTEKKTIAAARVLALTVNPKTLRMTLVYDNTRHGAHAQVTLNLT